MTTANDRTPPLVDFTATGWRSILDSMERYAQEQYGSGGEIAWTDFNPSNPGSLLFDAMAQVGEMLIHNLNAAAREDVVTTLLRKQSFINVSKSYDYRLTPADQASVELTIVSNPAKIPYTIPSSFKASNGDSNDPVIFQPESDILITETPQNAFFIEGDEIADEQLGVSDGSQFQKYLLAKKPLIIGTQAILVDGVEWTRYYNYVDMLATDTGYLLEENEEGYTLVKFGDGLNGKVPPTSADIRVTYKVGGGPRGQVGANSIQTIVTPVDGAMSINNVEKASGGNAAQKVEDGQKALPASIASLNRAVSEGDYAYQATRVPGVAKAIELPGNVAVKEVLLPIAPSGGGMPSTLLKNQVVRFFRTVRPVTFKVVPLDPKYLALKMSVDVFVKDTYRQLPVSNNLKTEILSLLSFDAMVFGGTVRLGGDGGLYPALKATVPGLEGVDYVYITELTTIPAINVAYGHSNTGNGDVEALAYSDTRKRRTWIVDVYQTSPYTGFHVSETILGRSSSIGEKTLVDEKANWVVNEHVGKTLNPNTDQAVTFTITGNTSNTITITTGNLQTVSLTGDEYSVTKVASVSGKVLRTTVDASSASGQKVLNVASTTNFASGDRVLIRQGNNTEIGVVDTVQAGVSLTLLSNLVYSYTSGATVDFFWQADDATTGFALVEGSTPFVIGDQLYYDLYPKLGDIEARRDELPMLVEANLAIRAVGGM